MYLPILIKSTVLTIIILYLWNSECTKHLHQMKLALRIAYISILQAFIQIIIFIMFVYLPVSTIIIYLFLFYLPTFNSDVGNFFKKVTAKNFFKTDPKFYI
uniref:Uncharacterized protein n=1 Tax=Cacopsylla melanoneura TaxID=428564 RepID=A0A8D8Z8S2_9HEMI